MLSAKAEIYGRDFRVVDRWEATSQRCSTCHQIGGKKALNVREWTCLYCGSHHDRDINAAKNIKVAGGHTETLNVQGGIVRPETKQAVSYEVQTTFKPTQLSMF